MISNWTGLNFFDLVKSYIQDACVLQRKDPPLQNDPWVISLHRGMTWVIILCRILGSGAISLRRIMTRVILLRSEMTHGSFCRQGHFSALHLQ